MSKITILSESCKGVEDCGICLYVCPREVLIPSEDLNERGYLPPRTGDESRCILCGNCMISCPDFAIIVQTGRSRKGKEGEDQE